MKILITGGAGFIGSHLAIKLVSLGHKVVILDNFESGNINNLLPIKQKVKIIKGSIEDKKLVEQSVDGIDTIFHLAAKITIQDSFRKQKEFKNINSYQTYNLLKSAQKKRIRKFIFSSSAAVYGDSKKLPLCEIKKPIPISPLGKTKFEAERYCALFKKKGMDVIIYRFFNVYGPGQNPNHLNVIPGFIKKILSNEPPIIYGDGYQTRDFVYIDDVIESCIAGLKKEKNNNFIFNIGSGKETSINSLLEILSKLLNKKQKVKYFNKRKGDIKRSLACICQAQRYLKFKPKESLTDGLSKVIGE